MQADMVNIGLGFLEGFALIISPCILPILPIMLSGSLVGGKRRPLGIIIGFIVMFALFVFFSRKLVQLSGIDLGIVRNISYLFLFLFGLIMLSPWLTDQFGRWTRQLVNTGSNFEFANDPQGGFLSGLIFGSLVALIWTPCAGPILAAVIVQTVLQQTTFESFLLVLAFGTGAALPMLFIVIFGRKIMEKLQFFKTRALFFRKLLGAIVIMSVVYLVYSENYAASSFVTTSSKRSLTTLQDGILTPYPAPAISGISAWINSPPIEISSLKGKVVLIDFWTYSCINCIRTLPYLKNWYAKYHDQGFEIIGIHTPEFDFEKVLANVKNAVQVQEIKYPIALDNNYQTWQNYHNQYWPAHYLIDKNGAVVYEHFGEGDYDTTENNIRFLLGMKQATTVNSGSSENVYHRQTPETYLGYARAENYASPEPLQYGHQANYSYPELLSEDQWALQGAWIVYPDKIVSATANAALKIHFNARKVFIVMGSAYANPIQVTLLLNGEKVLAGKGKDVDNSSIQANKHTLYDVLNLPAATSGIMQIIATSPGLEIYTFTFESP